MPKTSMIEPKEEEIIYQDNKLYFTLARYPMSRGHCVVVWNEDTNDIHLLKRNDYEYLMDKVEDLRDAMLNVLGVEKVYLLYLDEANHVHWHLVPRYDEKGLAALEGEREINNDFSLVPRLTDALKEVSN